MMRLSPVLLTTLAFLATPCVAQPKQEKKPETSVYVVGVTGMHWPVSCVAKVRETLKNLDGVNGVTVDFPAKKAHVTLGKGALARKDVTTALEGAGFGVSSFAAPPPRIWNIGISGMT